MRFPSFGVTAHINQSNGTWDDSFISEAESRRVLDQIVLIQEKLDGLNVGIFIDESGNFFLIQKDNIVDRKDYHLFPEIFDWYRLNSELIDSIIKGKYAVFGEFLFRSTHLQDIHKWIIIDAIEIKTNRFISYERLGNLASQLHLDLIPILYKGKIEGYSCLEAFIKKSDYYEELIEGVCLKIENNEYTNEKYKFVRKNFTK